MGWKNQDGVGGPVWGHVEDVAGLGDESRPALVDVHHDGTFDLALDSDRGSVAVFLGTGGATLIRGATWDPPVTTTRTAPGFFDADGDLGLVVEDRNAQAMILRSTGTGGTAAPARWTPPDPGSGPAGVTLASETLVPSVTPPGDSQIVASLATSAAEGGAPLRVELDATGSRAASGTPLTYRWDFGDGTTQIDRIARWYLQKIAPDLGGTAAGGFPELPKLNGTLGNITRATTKLTRSGCAIPAPPSTFATVAAAASLTGPVIEHVYTRTGTFTAKVIVSDGVESATATVTITVDGDGLPDAPGGAGGTVIRVTEGTEGTVRITFPKANAGCPVAHFQVTEPIVIHEPCHG